MKGKTPEEREKRWLEFVETHRHIFEKIAKKAK